MNRNNNNNKKEILEKQIESKISAWVSILFPSLVMPPQPHTSIALKSKREERKWCYLSKQFMQTYIKHSYLYWHHFSLNHHQPAADGTSPRGRTEKKTKEQCRLNEQRTWQSKGWRTLRKLGKNIQNKQTHQAWDDWKHAQCHYWCKPWSNMIIISMEVIQHWTK